MFAVSAHMTQAGIFKRQMEMVNTDDRRALFLAEATSMMVKLEALIAEEEAKQPKPAAKLSPYRRIECRACSVFGVTPKQIRSVRRDTKLVMARQFVMYWVIRTTDYSYPQTARMMSRDHTTLLHGVRKYVDKRAAMGRTLRPAR